jgi:O-antigen ligase
VTSSGLSQGARHAAAWLFAGLGFAIAVSTALDGLFTALLVLAWIAGVPQSFEHARASIATHKPLLAAVILFGLVLIGALHGDAPAAERWAGASKYLDLILIPIFLWAAGTRTVAKTALYAFLGGMALSLIVSYTMASGLVESIPGLRTEPDYPVGFRMSVTHNIMVAVSAFACLLLARDAATRGARLILLACAVIGAHNVLFVVIGRTGYLLLAVFLGYFVLLSLPGSRRKSLAFILIAALFTGAYFASDNFRHRLEEIRTDVAQWKPGAADKTSTGQRLEYALTTARIVAEHPLFGVGTGSFASAYRQAAPSALVTTNAHNDYLMLAAQVGIPAVILLVALYIWLWREAGTFVSPLARDLLRAAVLMLALGGFFNALLFDHVESLFFAWMVALAYGLERDVYRA